MMGKYLIARFYDLLIRFHPASDIKNRMDILLSLKPDSSFPLPPFGTMLLDFYGCKGGQDRRSQFEYDASITLETMN